MLGWRSTWTRMTLNGASGAPPTWRAVQTSTWDGAVEWVVQVARLLRPTVCARVGQAEPLALQAWPSASGSAFRRAIHDAALDQAHQQVGVDRGMRERLQVLAAIQCDHWTRALAPCALRTAAICSRATLVTDAAVGPRRCVQRQHPTASRIWYGHQPLIGPRRHDPALGSAGHWAVFPGAVSARACRRTVPVRAVNHPQWTTVDDRRVCQRAPEQLRQLRATNRPIRQRVAGARPTSAESCCQAKPHQRTAVGRRQRGIHQLEQAFLAEAQVVVERLTEVAERFPSVGFQHTPSLTRYSLDQKTLRSPGPLCCSKSS
jgi:hypothetical protein